MKDKEKIKANLNEIIFESDTPSGKLFDVILLVAIFLSVIVVMLDSVEWIHIGHGESLYLLEWFFTLLFTMEYILRIWISGKPIRYIFSFYGIIDLLSIIPTYLSLLFAGSQYLMVIRALRLMRIFRIFKLVRFSAASEVIIKSLTKSKYKIMAFLIMVLVLVVILGSMMYLIEGSEENSLFSSIPQSIYWAIVTLTTVGYGDITPTTVLGQSLAVVIMITGYSIIAVPTGIITVAFSKEMERVNSHRCINCSKDGHDDDAVYCKYCGEELNHIAKDKDNIKLE